MGKNKNKKRKQSHGDDNAGDGVKSSTKPALKQTAPKNTVPNTKRDTDANPLLTAQQRFIKSLSPKTRTRFFSPTHVTPDQRAEIWESQADLGENLVNSYAWATPDPRLLKVFQHFGPILEVGCGANAYWSKWMNEQGGVDVVALDLSLVDGGKISAKKSKKSKKNKGSIKTGGLDVRQGGPATLSEDSEIRDSGRTLFLCYPDEDYQQENNDDDAPLSMAAACLENFAGSTIIHVGELYGDTLSLEQAPFGRSSSSEFQQRLAGEYHCILKMKLENNWLHVRDTLSVWKRSATCCIAFENDDESQGDDESDDDAYYKYVPSEELLPVDSAAPCVAHLLGNNDCRTVGQEAKVISQGNDLGRTKEEDNSDKKKNNHADSDGDHGSDDDAYAQYSDDGDDDGAQPVAGNAW